MNFPEDAENPALIGPQFADRLIDHAHHGHPARRRREVVGDRASGLLGNVGESHRAAVGGAGVLLVSARWHFQNSRKNQMGVTVLFVSGNPSFLIHACNAPLHPWKTTPK